MKTFYNTLIGIELFYETLGDFIRTEGKLLEHLEWVEIFALHILRETTMKSDTSFMVVLLNNYNYLHGLKSIFLNYYEKRLALPNYSPHFWDKSYFDMLYPSKIYGI